MNDGFTTTREFEVNITPFSLKSCSGPLGLAFVLRLKFDDIMLKGIVEQYCKFNLHASKLVVDI